MQSRLDPYLSFKDNTREAMAFYQGIFGGKLDLRTFKEFNSSHDPSDDNKIMHSMLEADNGITFMAADTPRDMAYQSGGNISLTLNGDNEEELKNYWEKLSVGASIEVPLNKAPWGDMFGMLTDKFGIKWMVNITNKKS